MPDIWITPRIWTVGERVGQSKMNEISNNLRALYPYTAAGDISYRSTSGDYLAALAKGSAYQNLRMNSSATAPEWGGYIAGKAKRTSNQSISNSTLTNVQFDSTSYSRLVTWSSGDNTKLTIGATGLFVFGFSFSFDGGSGYREANIMKNGSNLLEGRIDNANGETTNISLTDVELFNSGDYLQLQVRHNNGSSINLRAASLFAAFIGA